MAKANKMGTQRSTAAQAGNPTFVFTIRKWQNDFLTIVKGEEVGPLGDGFDFGMICHGDLHVHGRSEGEPPIFRLKVPAFRMLK